MTKEGSPGFPGGVPWLPRRRFPSSPWPPGKGLPGPPGSPSGDLPDPPGPPGGGSICPLGDSGSQGTPRQSFMWQNGSAPDQSTAVMNRSVMQLPNRQPMNNYSYKHSRIGLCR